MLLIIFFNKKFDKKGFNEFFFLFVSLENKEIKLGGGRWESFVLLFGIVRFCLRL